ncbi:MAG: type VI secretion system baseplate subunit TssE [Iodobacter sp.]
MAGPALYEMLTTCFSDGTSIYDFDDNTVTILSVMESIQRILNSRAGSLAHLPDYGLPDLSMVYQQLPTSAHQLRMQMEITLRKYEPRLLRLDIELVEADDSMIMSFEMHCHLKEAGLVRFGTHFAPDEHVQVFRHLKNNGFY